MSDLTQLLNDITNAEINKQQLEHQLKILSDEYTLECKELQRLNDKNVEYSSALKEQENEKRQRDAEVKKEEDKANLNAFVNELSDNFRR